MPALIAVPTQRYLKSHRAAGPCAAYPAVVTYAIIVVSFGLSAGWIGKMKGSSFWIWFLIGAILPVLGTVCALLSRSERTELRRHCDRCRAVLPFYTQMCTVCGADLEFPEYALSPEIPERGVES